MAFKKYHEPCLRAWWAHRKGPNFYLILCFCRTFVISLGYCVNLLSCAVFGRSSSTWMLLLTVLCAIGCYSCSSYKFLVSDGGPANPCSATDPWSKLPFQIPIPYHFDFHDSCVALSVHSGSALFLCMLFLHLYARSTAYTVFQGTFVPSSFQSGQQLLCVPREVF